MTTTIYQAFFPLLLTGALLGLGGVMEYPVCKWSIFVNFVYILCLWSLYYYVFQNFMPWYTFHNIFDSTASSLTLYSNMFITAMSMFFCLFNAKNFARCLKKMSEVDDTLQGLGFRKEYDKIRVSMVFVVIGWFTTALFMNNIGCVWYDEEITIKTLFTFVLINHFVHTNTVLDLVFITLLLYARSRFCKLNQYIAKRCKNRDCLKKRVQDNCVTKSGKRLVVENKTLPLEDYDIWISMHIHLELSRICDDLNAVFEAQMLLEMTSFFIFIIGLISELYTTLTYYEFWDAWKLKKVLDIVLWNTFYIFKFLCINYTCDKVRCEANKTQEIIQKVIDSIHLTIREEVLQLISEITYKRLKFSAFGFYNYGYSFIRQFFGGITTLLIMLLQVETSPEFDVKPSPD